MKRLFKLGGILFFMAIALGPSLGQAFNSATHLYIAEQVFPDSGNKIDLYYGSIAPDLAMYVVQIEKWPTAFEDTHHTYLDLRRYAWSNTQKAFANGWLTHNEEWGADYYAHQCYFVTLSSCTGYVIDKAQGLLEETGPLSDDPELDLLFAHYVIETAIDLLVKNDDPSIGGKLLEANLSRSRQDRNFLTRILIGKYKRTDWATLGQTELIFRNLVNRYATALALPSPSDRETLSELGVQLAQEMYEITVTKEQLLGILEMALGLCEYDYKDVIQATILGINLRK